jgi:glycosyltransferase involved in cell wall biosynthesis/MoaA/NifB/PqqE/SkfB family radical SAM enzyme
MKILQVIHGYPMRYNAGSEVYTQTLCHGLAARGHEVHVFTRQEDSFAADFALHEEVDADDPRVRLYLVNNPRNRDRYRQAEIDARFAELLDRLRPDVVHIGHLNHLSTSLVAEASKRRVPIVFTLHDYWLMCPRGQFMQMQAEDSRDLWPACDGQADRKCAERCYARYFSGNPAESEQDAAQWTDWVARRMAHVREIAAMVDVFLAPAQYLRDRFVGDFGLDPGKVRYLDYGFDRERMAGRQRTQGEPFTFGYIGTHIPAKGIDLLIRAFAQVCSTLAPQDQPRLRIWGRPRGQDTLALQQLAARLLGEDSPCIEWLTEYRNQQIVRDVFDRVDAIVVPSIWVENSPLVIHEAQQAQLPVITADVGGMAEYVHHGVNGLLFRHRDVADLAHKMAELMGDTERARLLGQRGYLFSEDGQIPAIGAHSEAVEQIYAELLPQSRPQGAHTTPGPWRITFDTNPDDCNYACIMCEEHSPHSPLKIERHAQARPPRRMPIALLERIVAEQAGRGLREIIPSTMGEPLLYKDFDAILALCHRYHVKLNLTTNGSFPGRSAAEWAERIAPVTSDVKISWNGATKATHEAIMLHSRWEQVLDNVRTFIGVRDRLAQEGKPRCRVTFQLTFLDQNVGELADIVVLAAQLGVDRVKGHHLWVHGSAMADQSMRRSPQAAERWNQAVRQAHEAADQHRLADGRKVLLENVEPLPAHQPLSAAAKGDCPFLMQEAWVSADGRFSPCCAPDAERRSLGDFGDLHSQTLSNIWRSDVYEALSRDYASRALCGQCTMRKSTEVKP